MLSMIDFNDEFQRCSSLGWSNTSAGDSKSIYYACTKRLKYYCFYETRWTYNPSGKNNEKIIQAVKADGFKGGNFFSQRLDGRQLTKAITPQVIDSERFWTLHMAEIQKYYNQYGADWHDRKAQYERRGFGDTQAFVMAMGGAALMFSKLGKVAPVTWKLVLGLSAALGSAGSVAGNLMWKARGGELRLAENSSYAWREATLNVDDLGTESSYDDIMKTVADRAQQYKDVTVKNKKCQDLIPKDSELRDELRELSRRVELGGKSSLK